MWLIVPVEPEKSLRLRQRQSPVEGHQEGRPRLGLDPGPLVVFIRERKGPRDLVFTSIWGPGWGGKSLCRERWIVGRLLKTDQKEASSWY